MQKQAIFLMGPTASGKTALAMQLSAHIPLDIISVDSAMVYRGMDIGTGKPTTTELERFPHQLVDICDPGDAYSAAQFCMDATNAIEQSFANGRIPFLVGGTMLYFKALQFGLNDLPKADPDLRAQLTIDANAIGWPAMHARLAKIDPQAAQQLKPNDAQRIQRALEINILTGITLQANYALQNAKPFPYELRTLAIIPEDRSALHNAIEKRFDCMLDNGLVSEVEKLYAREDLHTDLPSIRAVGYRQVWDYLDGACDLATMREKAIAATRQLAKRQYTWLRSWPNLEVLTTLELKSTLTLLQL